MALITRCPVCGTQFKVVPDQLRISEGWVRCGQCSEVFDASGDLQQSADDFRALPEQGAEQSPVSVPQDAVQLDAAAAFSAMPLRPQVEESFTTYLRPNAEQAWGAVQPVEPVGVLDALEPKPESVEVLAETDDSDGPSLFASDDHVEEEFSPPVAPELEADALPHAAVEDYSFIRNTPERGGQHSRLVRGLLWSATGLLLLLLGLQVGVNGRDAIAANYPVVKPLLQATCARLGCRLQPLRQIGSVVIDSSSLGAVRDDAYHLSLVLKNHAVVDVAMPSIEFVLTDIDEQAVFSRVLSPADLGAPGRVLFAGREWATSVDFRVTDVPGKARIVGYRLLAFYPS